MASRPQPPPPAHALLPADLRADLERRVAELAAPLAPLRAPIVASPEARAVICDHIRKGCYIEVAARMGGLARQEFYRVIGDGGRIRRAWAQGRPMDLDSMTLREMASVLMSDEVEVARAEAEAVLVGIIYDAARKDWRAAETILRLRHPSRWGQTNVLRVDGPDEGGAEEEGDPVDAVMADVATKIRLARERAAAGQLGARASEDALDRDVTPSPDAPEHP